MSLIPTSTKREITFADSPNLDSFGRIRVSNPFTIWDNKNIYNRNENLWEEAFGGAGASITHLPNESSVQLQVGTDNAEFALRQTGRYLAYVPGKSHEITLTGILGAGKTNVQTRIGYFDFLNGLFFDLTGTTLSVVRRTKVTGTPVDVKVNQSDWNLDKMDGFGESRVKIDPSKAQIFIIRFQWLGSGTVKFGFNVKGMDIFCHEMNHSNVLSEVYMTTPSLPIRYEIFNIGVTASSSVLKEICCSVTSHGGYVLPGLEFTASNKVTTRSVTVRTPVLAIRLLNTFNTKANRRIMRIVKSNLYATTNDCCFELTHTESPSAITATWTSVGTGSGAEFSTDITGVSGNPEHVLEVSYVTTNIGNTGSSVGTTIEFINLHAFVSQNLSSTNSQMFVIYATSFSGTTNVSASMTWIEFD